MQVSPMARDRTEELAGITKALEIMEDPATKVETPDAANQFNFDYLAENQQIDKITIKTNRIHNQNNQINNQSNQR